MIPYEEAFNIILTSTQLGEETRHIKDAEGAVISQSVISGVNVPPFNNSAMDGFAVHAKCLAGASEKTPIVLAIDGSSAAGDMLGGGGEGAWEIMTGAPVPPVYDTVVKIEDVSVQQNKVIFTAPATEGENIRLSGEDISEGQIVIKEGSRLTPFHLMALATIGQKEVSVKLKPRISIFSTGKELVEDLDQVLKPGQIRNSNGLFLTSSLKKEGYDPFYGGVIDDDPELFEDRVRENLPATDIIISTGAVSAGKYDFIPDTIRKLGADVQFHKVAIQPGKPVFYARFKEGQHFFGLPGNPISSAIGLRFFILPLLRHMQGEMQEKPLRATLKNSTLSKPRVKLFRKAYVQIGSDGTNKVEILDGQESFKVSPMLKANCWALIDQNSGQLDEGEIVSIFPLFSSHGES